ncbi:hypothetical protein OH76DRAFT_1346367 [Lentinus brumalis]|uniref:JmjC domain-containing protein n=1 Tax=Lentinus brumalis TaxID=2498619 RepID=A0A371DH45_9APHY|nr:hypothetical protein OH76DRAFT_1346367 [Polyporus brumalis]
MRETNDASKYRILAQSERIAPVIWPGQDLLFRSLWKLNIPTVVQGLHHLTRGAWTPESFVRTHGAHPVTMLKSHGLPSERVSLARFFEEFGRNDEDRGHAVRLKDWPPSSSFEDEFRENYDAFMRAVPMQAYTRYDGYRNLISHYGIPPYPIKSQKPDVGPKVYIATKDVLQEGSTRLHLDATCAVNLLSWTSSSDPDTTGAEWDIFAPEDLPALRGYLRAKCAKPDAQKGAMDPVHAQQTYLTAEMLHELRAINVRPYKIKQRLGDAVFIPAGAAHQVSNCQPCIKVACDFLCIEGIAESVKVAADFRKYDLTDVMQLEIVLWDAWDSLTFHSRDSEENVTALSRAQKRKRRQRENERAEEDFKRRKLERKANIGQKCPHLHCVNKPRRFPQLQGLFAHMYVLCVESRQNSDCTLLQSGQARSPCARRRTSPLRWPL